MAAYNLTFKITGYLEGSSKGILNREAAITRANKLSQYIHEQFVTGEWKRTVEPGSKTTDEILRMEGPTGDFISVVEVLL